LGRSRTFFSREKLLRTVGAALALKGDSLP
jgi:hypothetical protein